MVGSLGASRRPGDAATSSLVGHALLESFGELILGIEVASDGGAAMLSIGARAEGAVLARNGAVCWAQAPGRTQPFLDRLIEAGALRERLEALLDEDSPQALGERLVAEGLIALDRFRGLLAEHNVEALVALARLEGAARSLTPLPFHQEISQPLCELTASDACRLAFASSVEMRVAAGLLPDLVTAVLSESDEGVCFLELPSSSVLALPLVWSAESRLSLREALLLYRKARRLADPAALVAAGVQPEAVAMSSSEGEWLFIHEPPHLLVIKPPQRAATVRALSALLASLRR